MPRRVAPAIRGLDTYAPVPDENGVLVDVPDLEALADSADDSGEAIAAMINGRRARVHTAGPAAPDGVAGLLAAEGPWSNISGTLAEGRHKGVQRLSSALRGRGGWRSDDALTYMTATVWPLIDQQHGGHPYPQTEFVADVLDAFTRYPDGPSGLPCTSAEQKPPNPAGTGVEVSDRPVKRAWLVAGGTWIHDAPAEIPALWGREDEVLWSAGESLILVGPPGVGKTTLGGQVLAGCLGLIDEVLGLPMTPSVGRVLYLAMDRPAQIRRALGRLLRQYDQHVLDDRLVVWQGPPPQDIARHPETLVQMAREHGATTVFLDSLKDAAVKLSDEEVGQGLNRAMQECVAEGIQVFALHHQTKRGAGGTGKPNTLADVYGSAWITAGAGSVILLWGAAGDPVVELSHLKQPAAEVGPLRIVHDHDTGTSEVFHGVDILQILNVRPCTPREIAVATYGEKPTDAEVEKAAASCSNWSATASPRNSTTTCQAGGMAPRKGEGPGQSTPRYRSTDRSTHPFWIL